MPRKVKPQLRQIDAADIQFEGDAIAALKGVVLAH
jgi:hypothetical protein